MLLHEPGSQSLQDDVPLPTMLSNLYPRDNVRDSYLMGSDAAENVGVGKIALQDCWTKVVEPRT
jgi:hypothetical protein